MNLKIFYAAGPGDIIGAHRSWKDGQDDPTQMSLTYSGQFEDLCQDVNATAYLVSSHPNRQFIRDGRFTFEHRPKRVWGVGLLYHLSEILYGISLVRTAVRFRADVAVISSGTTHYFALSLFRLFGIRVITILHNTLWPTGYPPAKPMRRLVSWLDGLFFQWSSTASIGVSAECVRQVKELTRGRAESLHVMYPQFRRQYFQSICPTPPFDRRPFRIVFAGRIERNKGVFDILQMARQIDDAMPGAVHWDICGLGSDLDSLVEQRRVMRLEAIVTIHGWTPPTELREIQGSSHLSIVPTRSDFAEGMAKTAIEAVLAGRPVIASSVTPALELLAPASIKARADDIQSHVDAVLGLIKDGSRYSGLVAACRQLQEQFYDGQHSFSSVLKRTLEDNVLKPQGIK